MTPPDAGRRSATHAPVARRALAVGLQSAPIQLTLLGLYALPLLLTLLGTVTSSGFTHPSAVLDLALQVTLQYIENLRELFAMFVVPFVTAYAAGSARNDSGGLGTVPLFFMLCCLLLTAIVLTGLLNAREDAFFRIQERSPEEVLDLYNRQKELIAAYTKELLVYISLLLGVRVGKAA